MATPANDLYSCASGSAIRAGLFFHPPIVGNQRISIWGQSNAQGWAERSGLSASPLSDDPGLATYGSGTFSRVYIWDGSAYSQLNSANHKSGGGTQMGPEFGLAVRWMRETTTGNLYIDKEAVASTSIDHFVPGGTFYNTAKGRRISANTWLSSNGISVTDAGLAWVQGESDKTQTQNWYQARLEALIAAWLADGIISSWTKRLLMNMVVGSFLYDANIVAAKNAIAAASPSNTLAVDMVPTFAGYMNSSDLLHALARGQVHMGYRTFEYFFSAPHIGV